MDAGQVTLVTVAGLAAGAVNALAGGGSLLTYPALVAIGLPPVQANVTNSVSVCPGYLAAVAGSRAGLVGQRHRSLALMPTAAGGALIGCLLLLWTPPGVFEVIVPFLVIAGALLLAFQQRIRRFVGHPATLSPERAAISLHVMTGIGCIYGGYFGAALGVMLVACLALMVDEPLARVSALKNTLSAVVGIVTVVLYGLFGPVQWLAVALVAPSTLVGGYLGGRLLRVLPQRLLRAFIVTFGLVIGVYLLLK